MSEKKCAEMHANQPQGACLRNMRCLLHQIRWADGAQMPSACRENLQLHHRAPRLQCGESPHHLIEPCSLKRRSTNHCTQAGCWISESPDLRPVRFFLRLIRHARSPLPVTCTADATASALEQDPGRGPFGSRCAVHPSPSGACRAARVRGGDAEGRDELVRRMARCDDRWFASG